MASLKITKLAAPSGGMNDAAGPEAVASDECEYIENFLIGYPGKIMIRGAVYDEIPNVLPPVEMAKHVKGLRLVDPTRAVVTKSNADNGKIRPWQTPWATGYAKTDLDTAVAYDLSNGVARTPVVGSGTRLGVWTYAFEYGPSDYSGNDLAGLGYVGGKVGWQRRLRAFYQVPPFESAGFDIPYPNTVAPVSGQAVIAHLDRLWVLGGYTPAATAASSDYEPNTLFFTQESANSLLPLLASAWQSPSGTLNRIRVPGNPGDYGVGLARVNQNLVIFMNNSVWVLYGDDPDNFTLRQQVTDRGCIEPNSIYEADGGVYFFSQRGIEFFDGSESRIVSRPIQSYIEWFAQEAKNQSECMSCVIGDSGGKYLRVSLNMDGRTGLITRINLMMNRETGGWVVFSGDGFKEATAHSEGLWAELGQLRNHNYVTREHVRGNSRYINCSAEVRYRRVTPPPDAFGAQLHRVSLDTNASDDSVSTPHDETAGYIFSVNMRESTGRAIMQQQSIRAQARAAPNNSGFPTGRRSVFDTFHETADMQLILKYHYMVGEKFNRGEIYDGAIEWSETNQRRSTRR